MAKYDGWANWATWNIALWLANEEPIYLAARELVSRHGSVGSDLAKRFCENVWPLGTPDMSGPEELDVVDWYEIAVCIDELAPTEA